MEFLEAKKKREFIKHRLVCDVNFVISEFRKRFKEDVLDSDIEAIKIIHRDDKEAIQYRQTYKSMTLNEMISTRIISSYEKSYRLKAIEQHAITSVPTKDNQRLHEYVSSTRGLALAHHNLNISYFFGLLYQYATYRKFEGMFSSCVAEIYVEDIIERAFSHRAEDRLVRDIFDQNFTRSVKKIADALLIRFTQEM